MSTHGSNRFSRTLEPTSRWVNIWVWMRFYNDEQKVKVMSIYDFRKIRNKILIGDTSAIVTIQRIKPKNEDDYLIINQLDKIQMQKYEETKSQGK